MGPLLVLLLLFAPLAAHSGGTLRIGLNEDPDVLDPARGGFAGRLVCAAGLPTAAATPSRLV